MLRIQIIILNPGVDSKLLAIVLFAITKSEFVAGSQQDLELVVQATPSQNKLPVSMKEAEINSATEEISIGPDFPIIVINESPSEELESTLSTTEIPSNMISTNTVFTASADSSMDFVPSTGISLADRLKLKMSTNNESKNPTDRTQRHLRSSTEEPSHSILREETTESIFNVPEAEHIITSTTELVHSFKPTSPPPSQATGFSKKNVTETPSSNHGKSGVMSLAELLAMSNKAKSSIITSNSPPVRRRPVASRDRFPDQVSKPTGSTQRIGIAPTKFRFQGRTKPSADSEDDERRIPVRNVDDLPKIKFNFPMRNPSRQPVTFRTAIDPDVTTENSDKVTVAESENRGDGKTTRKRFIPSSTASTTIDTVVSIVSSTTPQSMKVSPSEVNCPELQCIDGTCIAISQLNDGVVDCSDGSDEKDFGALVT